jgi:teichuronic acid exporter
MGMAQIAVRVSRLLATIVLSRLLLPSDYGTAAIVLTVYELIALFTRNGISAKVVRASQSEVLVVAMTAWRMTWIICFSLLVLQCIMAYPIAWFYGDMRLAIPIAAMSIVYLATPLSNIQSAFQQREGHLGRMAFAAAAQVVVDNILTACFAILGFGLWAIILPKILVAPIWIVIVRYGHSWRPKPIAGVHPFQGWRDIMSFSRSVLGTELLSTLQANIDNMFVGFYLGLNALGLYYFAFNAGLGMTLGLITAAGMAVFPHLCELRDDRAALEKRFFKTRNRIGFGLVSLIIMQALLAPIYVPLIFGSKWNDAIPALSIICLSALARPFANVTSQLLKAVGRPEIEFRWQLVNTLMLIGALFVAAQFNILAVAVSVFVVQTIVLGAFAFVVPKAVFSANAKEENFDNNCVVRIIDDQIGFDNLKSDWNALWKRVPNADASKSYRNCRMSWKKLAGQNEAQLHIVCAYKAGQLLQVLPLVTKFYAGTRLVETLNVGAVGDSPALIDPSVNSTDILDRVHAHLDSLKLSGTANLNCENQTGARNLSSRRHQDLKLKHI